jgi:4-amino-4-deoxy-L-arabinose transferase-like glycosyltransferase
MTTHSRRRQPQPAPPPPPENPQRWLLPAIIAAYLAAAVSVAFIVPDSSGTEPKLIPPDEPAHWCFIRDLAQGKGLPVFYSGSDNYEAHQPPLYYLAAIWCYWVAGEHSTLLCRLFSAALGALTLLVAWRASQYLLGEAPWPRLAAVGALALIPGRFFILGSVSNDPAFELTSALTLWQSLAAVRHGLDLRRAALLGACLAAALLAKTSALVLIPIVGLAVVMAAQRPDGTFGRSEIRQILAHAGVVLGAVALFWGWWVVRNLQLYGEPLVTSAFTRIFIKDRATPEFFLSRGITWSGYFTLVAWQTQMSLWGVFGQATVYMPSLYYRIGYALEALTVLGLLVAAARSLRRREPPAQAVTASWLLVVLLVLLTLATFLRFNIVFYQAQARYFLGVSVPLAALLAAGVCSLVPQRPRAAALGIMAVFLALAVWAVVAHATGAYTFVPPGLSL